MPASRTPKRSARKDKGKAPATPRRPPSRSPPFHYAPLFSYPTLRKPNWLDRVLVVLLVLYSRRRTNKSISIKKILVGEVEKHSLTDHQYPLAGSNRSWLTNIYNALASFRRHKLIEWRAHRQDHEGIKLTPKLEDIFNDLLEDVRAETRFGGLSSLDVPQHRALCMWFRDFTKKNKIKSLTKHEGYMAQMDVEKEKDDLEVEHNKIVKQLGRLKLKHGTRAKQGQSERPGGHQTTRSVEAEHNDNGDIDMPGEEPPAASLPNCQNAVAGPSRLPRTPQRRSIHNPVGPYPTPESRPRKTQAEEPHGGASTAEPPIRALSLPGSASSDNDNDFYDANDEMDIDDPPPPAPTRREVELESQVTDLTRDKKELLSRNAELLEEIDKYKSQIAELDGQVKAEKDATEESRKELEKKEGLLDKAKKIEVHLRSKLENFTPDKLVDLKVLELSHAKYKALSERLDRENTQMRKELDSQDEVIKAHEVAQKRNQEAIAMLQTNFIVVSPR